MSPPALPAWSWNPVLVLALGLGSGRAPVAPGTFGTLVGVLLYLPLSLLNAPAYLGVTVLVALVGIPICGRAATLLGVHDHPAIVWDEIAGYLVTLLPVAFGVVAGGWVAVLAGFGLFRLFDIWKPWPIGPIDRQVHGGLGIMLDDIIAGALAALALIGLARLPLTAAWF